MIEAAVGFQCPECVAQGARETRSDRNPFGGRRSAGGSGALLAARQTMFAIIGANLLVFLAITLTRGSMSRLLEVLALMPRGACLSTANPGSYYPGTGSPSSCSRIPDGTWAGGMATGSWWQPLTSVFTHEAFLHLALNMVSLFVVGQGIAMVLGRVRFLVVYLLSGLAGSALVVWLTPPDSQTLGASGAIFGLLGAWLLLLVKLKRDLRQVLLWLGINLVATFLLPGISWQGHTGGFVGGCVVSAIILWAPRQNRERWQWAGIAAVAVLVVAAIVVRAIQLR